MKISRILLLILCSTSVAYNANTLSREEFEKNAIKGSLWGRYKLIKMADEIKNIKFSPQQKEKWNKLVEKYNAFLSEIESFNKSHNGIIEEYAKMEAKAVLLNEERNKIEEIVEKEFKNIPENKKVYDEIEQLQKTYNSIDKKNRALTNPIRNKIAPIETIISKSKNKLFDLYSSREEIVKNNPEYKKEYSEITQKYRSQGDDLYNAISELEKKFEAKYSTNPEFMKIHNQIKNIENEIKSLQNSIKTDRDKIDSILKSSRLLSRKIFELRRPIYKKFNDYFSKHPSYAKVRQTDPQLQSLQSKIDELHEKNRNVFEEFYSKIDSKGWEFASEIEKFWSDFAKTKK